MSKTFILDTNVLLHNSDSTKSFEDNTVILPMAVIEELDNFKSRNDELGRNARKVIRHLDKLRRKGSLKNGVTNGNGGVMKIVMDSEFAGIDIGLDTRKLDNRILQVAYGLHQKGEKVIFVSKDINARLKADSLGLEARDFEKQKINIDELYSGYREIKVAKEIVDDFHENNNYTMEGLNALPNEFILLIDKNNEKHTAMGRVKGKDNIVRLNPLFDKAWDVKTRNREQRIAFELLLDPSVQLVTLVGQAGTGKTLLALAAALEAVQRFKQYDRILVSRPIIPLGKDIGYLPGDKDEKLFNWMQPIFDNLTYLMSHEGGDKDSKHSHEYQSKVEKLLKNHVVELEAMTYIRGRSIPNQYVIVDEAQNLTPHEIKTIISRAGEGTKMVLTGDPYQIDNPYLDSSSNGLTYTVDRLKTHSIHGHITLKKSERSALSAIAADFL